MDNQQTNLSCVPLRILFVNIILYMVANVIFANQRQSAERRYGSEWDHLPLLLRDTTSPVSADCKELTTRTFRHGYRHSTLPEQD